VQKNKMHTPVLLKEVIDGLSIEAGAKYIDATVGEGGHASHIADLGAKVLCLDRDKDQIDKLNKKYNSPNMIFVQANFADLEKVARKHDFDRVKGALFDLGLSWTQLITKGKGLSYRNTQDPLDMRLTNDTDMTAELILNTYSAEQLYDIFSRNSEEIRAYEIAENIVYRRKSKKFKTVADLNGTIYKVMGSNAGKTYNRIFQALRIEINDEFENLKKGLEAAISVIVPGGKLAVISFHSLEDRIVKQFMKKMDKKQTTKNAIRGDRTLSFESSARLRVFLI